MDKSYMWYYSIIIISCHNLTIFFSCEFSEATADELRLQREEKKRYLLRKLSFRPSVDELKNRKVNIDLGT